jgi:hypothetical protein
MVTAQATAVVPIVATLVHKHDQLGESVFADYLQANMVPAIVNFVILGCNFVILAEWVAKRARLDAINSIGLITQEPDHFPLLVEAMKLKNAPVELDEAAYAEAEAEFREMMKVYQPTVEDARDDESIERERRRCKASLIPHPHRPRLLEDRTNSEKNEGA